MHHDQIQAYFNIKNWCNSPHNKILKGKNITTIDAEKTFHKIQHPLMIKKTSQQHNKGLI